MQPTNVVLQLLLLEPELHGREEHLHQRLWRQAPERHLEFRIEAVVSYVEERSNRSERALGGSSEEQFARERATVAATRFV